MGLGKVWPDLEILEVFLMGVEVSFLDNFFFLPKGFGVSDLSFFLSFCSSGVTFFRVHVYSLLN